jgi:hypothetical protein
MENRKRRVEAYLYALLFETIGCQASEYFLVSIDVSYKMANSLGQDFSIILEPCGSL